MLQTDVKVFGLVRLHTTQSHPRLPNELIMCQLVFVTHGHPGSGGRGGEGGEGQQKMVKEGKMNKNKRS